jgi:hypothetical protein
VLWVRTTGFGPWRHTGQPHFPHQSLHPFSINAVTHSLEKNHHPATAVKWVPGVFLVDQMAEQQITFINLSRNFPPINRCPADTCQQALPGYRHPFLLPHPSLADYNRLIPDFFFNQSSSIFSLPISLNNRSGSLCAAIGFGPRLPSNSFFA